MTELRKELEPPPLDGDVVDRLTRLGDQIVTAIDSGTDCTDLLAEFNAATGKNYDRGDFDAASGSMSMREFVKLALTEVPRNLDITRDECLEIIRRLQRPLEPYSMCAGVFYLHLLRKYLPHPRIEELFRQYETPEDILDAALRHEPFLMPPT